MSVQISTPCLPNTSICEGDYGCGPNTHMAAIARIMPVFHGKPWNESTAYGALEVVEQPDGVMYITKCPTPAGTPLDNCFYWAVYNENWNVRLENVEEEIDQLQLENKLTLKLDLTETEYASAGTWTCLEGADFATIAANPQNVVIYLEDKNFEVLPCVCNVEENSYVVFAYASLSNASVFDCFYLEIYVNGVCHLSKLDELVYRNALDNAIYEIETSYKAADTATEKAYKAADTSLKESINEEVAARIEADKLLETYATACLIVDYNKNTEKWSFKVKAENTESDDLSLIIDQDHSIIRPVMCIFNNPPGDFPLVSGAFMGVSDLVEMDYTERVVALQFIATKGIQYKGYSAPYIISLAFNENMTEILDVIISQGNFVSVNYTPADNVQTPEMEMLVEMMLKDTSVDVKVKYADKWYTALSYQIEYVDGSNYTVVIRVPITSVSIQKTSVLVSELVITHKSEKGMYSGSAVLTNADLKGSSITFSNESVDSVTIEGRW